MSVYSERFPTALMSYPIRVRSHRVVGQHPFLGRTAVTCTVCMLPLHRSFHVEAIRRLPLIHSRVVSSASYGLTSGKTQTASCRYGMTRQVFRVPISYFAQVKDFNRPANHTKTRKLLYHNFHRSSSNFAGFSRKPLS